MVARARLEDEDAASQNIEPAMLSVLNVLSFSGKMLPLLWAHVGGLDVGTASSVEEFLSDDRRGALAEVDFSCWGGSYNEALASVLLFACLLSNTLMLTDDDEILRRERPLPLHHVRRVIVLFKKFMHRAILDGGGGRDNWTFWGLSLINNVSKVRGTSRQGRHK